MAILMFLGMVQFGMYLYGLSIFENEAVMPQELDLVRKAAPQYAKISQDAAFRTSHSRKDFDKEH
jgi:hypothetical protein